MGVEWFSLIFIDFHGKESWASCRGFEDSWGGFQLWIVSDFRPAAAGLTNFGASDGTCGEWTVQQPDHVEETCRKINHPCYNLYNLQLWRWAVVLYQAKLICSGSCSGHHPYQPVSCCHSIVRLHVCSGGISRTRQGYVLSYNSWRGYQSQPFQFQRLDFSFILSPITFWSSNMLKYGWILKNSEEAVSTCLTLVGMQLVWSCLRIYQPCWEKSWLLNYCVGPYLGHIFFAKGIVPKPSKTSISVEPAWSHPHHLRSQWLRFPEPAPQRGGAAVGGPRAAAGAEAHGGVAHSGHRKHRGWGPHGGRDGGVMVWCCCLDFNK